MKTIFLSFLLLISGFAFGQYQTGNYPLGNPGPYPQPLYATGGNTGASVTYGYTELSTQPTNDSVKYAGGHTHTLFTIDSVTANFTILADTTGDTLRYATQWGNKTWYKKNPYITTWNGDEVIFVFNGSVTQTHHITFSGNFNNTLSHDTLHVGKSVKSTGAGQSQIAFRYNYLKNAYYEEWSITQ